MLALLLERLLLPPPLYQRLGGQIYSSRRFFDGSCRLRRGEGGGSIPFLLDCLQLCQIRRSQAFPPPGNSLVDTLFRDVHARVLDCLTRRHVIDDALDHLMWEGGGGGIQAPKMSLLYDKIKPQTHKKMVTNMNALSFGPPASSIGNMPVSKLMALA